MEHFLDERGELVGDEEHLSQVLFGSTFARAHAAIARGDEDDNAAPANDERPGRSGPSLGAGAALRSTQRVPDGEWAAATDAPF